MSVKATKVAPKAKRNRLEEVEVEAFADLDEDMVVVKVGETEAVMSPESALALAEELGEAVEALEDVEDDDED